MSFEIVRREWRKCEDSGFYSEDIFVFEDGRVMNSSEFSEYYKNSNHIVII